MKLKQIIKKLMKNEGSKSEVVRKVATLQNSKEFNYLVDTKKV
jgi:hypothetical protein